MATKGERSKRHLRYLFTIEIWHLSNCFIPNFHVFCSQSFQGVTKNCFYLQTEIRRISFIHLPFPPLPEEGPVGEDGVLPLLRIQLKSSFWSCLKLHIDGSLKSHDKPTNEKWLCYRVGNWWTSRFHRFDTIFHPTKILTFWRDFVSFYQQPFQNRHFYPSGNKHPERKMWYDNVEIENCRQSGAAHKKK